MRWPMLWPIFARDEARLWSGRGRQSARYARLPPDRRIRTNAELDGQLLDDFAEPNVLASPPRDPNVLSIFSEPSPD